MNRYQVGDIVYLKNTIEKNKLYKIEKIIEGESPFYKVVYKKQFKWLFRTAFRYATPNEIKQYNMQNMFINN
jgi:hypothetical protein